MSTPKITKVLTEVNCHGCLHEHTCRLLYEVRKLNDSSPATQVRWLVAAENIGSVCTYRVDKEDLVLSGVTEEMLYGAESRCLGAVDYVGQANYRDREREAKGRVREVFKQLREGLEADVTGAC